MKKYTCGTHSVASLNPMTVPNARYPLRASGSKLFLREPRLESNGPKRLEFHFYFFSRRAPRLIARSLVYLPQYLQEAMTQAFLLVEAGL